jgi:succinyl-diaminopimelate desuccinylase
VFQEFIERHRQDMIDTLRQLLQIESVEGPASPGMPFGPGPAKALEFVLQLAQAHGFGVKNVDGYAGHVEFGSGDDYVAVLSHLDVVPAGDGWQHPPFAAEIHDGKIYARGAVDDKGPALSTLWALIVLKEQGFQPKRKIRLIFGLDEESGWKCVEHYFSKEPKPLGGFTPDADFPLIYAEKGVASVLLSTRAELDSMSPTVLEFEGGLRVNMVADKAVATVECHSETAAREWEERIYREAKQRQVDVDIQVSGSRVRISVTGASAHGSTPEKGVNAIVQLAGLLSCQPVANAWMWRFVSNQDVYGRNLGIACSDEITGPLTSNLGQAVLDGDQYRFWFDIRYPVRENIDELVRRIQEYVSDKWRVELKSDKAPLYVPVDSPVVQTLGRVYEACTSLPFQPIAIGGATYARAIPNAVAFGPLFPGQPDVIHQRDEYWAIDDYLRCIEIYAHAIRELSNIL